MDRWMDGWMDDLVPRASESIQSIKRGDGQITLARLKTSSQYLLTVEQSIQNDPQVLAACPVSSNNSQ